MVMAILDHAKLNKYRKKIPKNANKKDIAF